MEMDMYWSQQEVFLMGTLSLFPDKLKDKPITPEGEWRHYFNNNYFEQLAQQLNKYKQAGYIDFDEETVKVMPIGSKDAPNFHTVTDSFTITEVDANKVMGDLVQYLKKWCNDRLLTNTAYKPDDSAHQHEKLLAALARVYDRQDMPRVNVVDVFGDNVDYNLPFWETVLAPQLIDNQYEIRQMDYDANNREQPFVDIKITDVKLHRSLELAAKSSEPIGDDDPGETLPYKGLQAKRDGLIYYNDEEVPFTPQQRDVMRVLLKRPDELRSKEAFTDSDASIFSRENYPNIDDTLAKLVAATHAKLRIVVGKECIFNTAGQGWKLKL